MTASTSSSFSRGGKKIKMLHHLSSLCLRGGTCEAEEDAKCLLVRTVEKGLERVTHFLFFDSYHQHCSFDRALNPFSGGKVE